MKTLTGILKLTALGTAAGLMMGNTQCSQTQEPVAARQLKNLVETGQILAQPVQVSDTQVFDLQFVVNQQFPDVLLTSGQYAVINRSGLGAGQSVNHLTTNDFNLMSKTGGLEAESWYTSKEAACLINLPQYRLNGAVNSYEWVSGGGLTIGYSPTGSHAVTNIGGSVKFDRADMNLSLRAMDSITGKSLAVATIDKSQIKTKVGFTISFGLISIGPEFYYQTGLAKTTQEALQLGLTALRKLVDNLGWKTRTGLTGEFPTIVGGKDVGLEAGDVVAFYNTRYSWDDQKSVCDPSHYIGGLDGVKIATGVVQEAGDFISSVKLDQDTMLEDPLPGAVVKLVKFHDATPPIQ